MTQILYHVAPTRRPKEIVTPIVTAVRTPPHRAPRPDPHVRRWIAHQIARTPPRAPSLIVTVWGDAIAPHGGAVVLPGLIRLLAPFGVNERLVRTSVFRLARQGWLEARPLGRRSLYSLTPDGARRFAGAQGRIYTAPDDRWDGAWELVLADGLTPDERRALAVELHWAPASWRGRPGTEAPSLVYCRRWAAPTGWLPPARAMPLRVADKRWRPAFPAPGILPGWLSCTASCCNGSAR